MATQAKGGFRTHLYMDDGAGNWTKIAECRDFSGPQRQHVVEDATSHDSDGWAEKVAVGLRDGGDVTFQCNLLQDDASQALLHAANASGALRSFRLVPPSQTRRLNFSAIVANISDSYPVRGIMMHDVTLSISGAVTRTSHP